MTETTPLPADTLVQRVDITDQRMAAALAQRIFAEVFRHSFTTDPAVLGQTLTESEGEIIQWCEAGADEAAQILRLALVIHGLDQWGLAYVQTFELKNLPALSALIGSVRTRLSTQSDALFQQYFMQIEDVETDAVDFKVELRRGIHLALWHAMAACETATEAESIARSLGSMMLTLQQKMPDIGWRLLADALAHIQIALLGDNSIGNVARNATQQLFDALAHTLPKDLSLLILRQSGQAVMAWQQQRRGSDTLPN